MRLRVGTAGRIRNFIVMGFKSQGIDVRDAAALPLIADGSLSVTHGLIFQTGSGGTAYWGSSAQSTAARTASAGTIAEGVDPMLVAPYSRTAPDWRPLAGSPALTLTPAVPPNDGFFEVALYRGALGPELANDWTRGWTYYGR
jgi:hypothetical protein